WGAESPTLGLAAAVGCSLAATFLTKISNLPLVAAALSLIAIKLFNLARGGNLKQMMPTLALLALCAGLPVSAWMIWCKINFGDITGSYLKVRLLGWVDKPFDQWFHHPLFTLGGLGTFVSGNLRTFWQGELLWHGKPLAFYNVDLVY